MRTIAIRKLPASSPNASFAGVATAITFEPGGVVLDLRFRTRRIRGPVVELSGGRTGGVTLHDLRADRKYTLPQPAGSTHLVEVAERHGYPVVHRPHHIFG